MNISVCIQKKLKYVSRVEEENRAAHPRAHRVPLPSGSLFPAHAQYGPMLQQWDLTGNRCSTRSLITLLGYSEISRVKMEIVSSTKTHSQMATWDRGPQSLPQTVRHEKRSLLRVSNKWGKEIVCSGESTQQEAVKTQSGSCMVYLLILSGKSPKKLSRGRMKGFEQTVRYKSAWHDGKLDQWVRERLEEDGRGGPYGFQTISLHQSLWVSYKRIQRNSSTKKS